MRRAKNKTLITKLGWILETGSSAFLSLNAKICKKSRRKKIDFRKKQNKLKKS
jgi:hypothetical protein